MREKEKKRDEKTTGQAWQECKPKVARLLNAGRYVLRILDGGPPVQVSSSRFSRPLPIVPMDCCPSFLWTDASRSSKPSSDDSLLAALNPLRFTETNTPVNRLGGKQMRDTREHKLFFMDCQSNRQGHKFCFAFTETAAANTVAHACSLYVECR